MARGMFVFLFAILNVGIAFGMDCSFGQSQNVIDKIFRSCPGIAQSSDKSFCCLNKEGEFYCCTEAEFVLTTGLAIGIPVIITIAIVASLVIFCISCLCCSCCPWYRRRHRGTVYGKVRAPVVHVVQTPAATITAQNIPYVQTSAGMPQSPPPYTEQPYAKQAPYNPNYPQ